MEFLAIVCWLATAPVGAYLFSHTVRIDPSRVAAVPSRLPTTLFFHPVGGITAVTLMLIYLTGAPAGVAWAAFGVLLATAAFGEYFFVRWLRERRRLTHPEQLVEQQIPLPALALHGVLAAATLISFFVIALTA